MKIIIKTALLCSISIGFTSIVQAQQSGVIQQMDSIKTVYGIPQSATDISPLLYGENIPKAILKDAAGKDFDLNQAVAQKATILIFYRGGWCPYCSKQLAGLQEIAPKLTQLGYQMLAVSTDKPEGLTATITKEKLNYTLLSDADLSLAKQFGIAFKAPKNYAEFLPEASGSKNTELLLPTPSIYILDKKGQILFEYINPDYKQRMNPNLLISVAKELINSIK